DDGEVITAAAGAGIAGQDDVTVGRDGHPVSARALSAVTERDRPTVDADPIAIDSSDAQGPPAVRRFDSQQRPVALLAQAQDRDRVGGVEPAEIGDDLAALEAAVE